MTTSEPPRPRDQYSGQPEDPAARYDDTPHSPTPVSGGVSAASPVADSSGSGTTDTREQGKQGKQVAQDAKESGRQVAQDAKESGKQVAETAQEEARNVASTVGEQARTLIRETTSEVSAQAGTQQQRLAGGLRSLSQEFGSMAEGSNEDAGQATGLVREAAERTQGLADWLEQHEPGDVLEEVKRFARRKPGTFIAIAAGVGLLAGRMTRGLTSNETDSQGRSGPTDAIPGSADGVGTRPTTEPYAAPPVSAGLPSASGSPVAARPVGAGPANPGPMSGIGAGPVAGSSPSGSGAAIPAGLDREAPSAYGQDPR